MSEINKNNAVFFYLDFGNDQFSRKLISSYRPKSAGRELSKIFITECCTQSCENIP
jgi:hypothetical protein